MSMILTSQSSGTMAMYFVSKDMGGFGQDVSTGLTNDNVAIVSSNAVTIGALTVTAIPSSIPATKIGTGSVDDTEFGYLDGVTSSIQTQINTKVATTDTRLAPIPSVAGRILYDNGSSWVTLSPSTSNTYLNSGTTPAWSVVSGIILQSAEAHATTDLSTTSSSLSDMTGVSITISKTSGTKILVNCSFSTNTSSLLGETNTVVLVIDGNVDYGSGSTFPGIANSTQGGGISRLISGLSAGSHTFKLQWKTTGGTARCRANSLPTTEHASMTLLEINI